MSDSIHERVWPRPDAGAWQASIEFLSFVVVTAINKVEGLTDEQARVTPLPTSPAMSPLGLLKHLTAVLRQHVQLHIGGSDLPSLWRSDDLDFEFRLAGDETAARIIATLADELHRSTQTLAGIDPEQMIVAHGKPVRAARLLVDVVQECARHLGHIDILREMIDGSRGE